MRDDVPRAGLLTTRADKKERRNEKKGRRAQKTTRTLVLVFLRKETVVVVVGRATGTREVDNENIFWLKLRFLRWSRDGWKKMKEKKIFLKTKDQQIFLCLVRGVKL